MQTLIPFILFTSITIFLASHIPTARSSQLSLGYSVTGFVKLDAPRVKASNVKIILDGGDHISFVRSDGYFTLVGVSPGPHYLEVSAPGASFHPVRLDVSARRKGEVTAMVIKEEESFIIPCDPLVLEPHAAEAYFEKREPITVWGFLKSPMGMMVAFMAVVVFLLPRLMDSIDPEEMKQMQEEMKRQPTPSISTLLGMGESKK